MRMLVVERLMSPEGRNVPTILREGCWRFFIHSNETAEPPRMHVESSGVVATFYLTPVSVARSQRIGPHELHRLSRMLATNREWFVRQWNEHFAHH